jgi:hypothetical protein
MSRRKQRETEAAPVAPARAADVPPNWVRCRALRTVLARGMPQYEGDVFLMPEEKASPLFERGDIEIL